MGKILNTKLKSSGDGDFLFKVKNERWSKYRVENGSLLTCKNVSKVLESGLYVASLSFSKTNGLFVVACVLGDCLKKFSVITDPESKTIFPSDLFQIKGKITGAYMEFDT